MEIENGAVRFLFGGELLGKQKGMKRISEERGLWQGLKKQVYTREKEKHLRPYELFSFLFSADVLAVRNHPYILTFHAE